jgi:Amt family ammonium transporter
VLYGSWDLFKAHTIGSLAIIALSVVGTFIAFKIADMIFGMRVSEGEEMLGLDQSQHGELINSNIEQEEPLKAKKAS